MAATCPFCNKDIQKAVFKHSENFLAVFNIAPVLPGHVMVIPKKHRRRIMDLSEEELCEMVSFSREVMKLLSKAFDNDSFDWTIQEGEPAGQTITHLHLHLIPRKEGDLKDPGDWYPKLEQAKNSDSSEREKLTNEDLKRLTIWLIELDNTSD